MQNKCRTFAHFKRLKQSIQVAAVLEEPIGTRTAVVQLVRIAHADQIGGKAASQPLQMRNDIAPDIGRGGIAMQKDNGITLSNFDIGHLMSQHCLIVLFIRKGGTDRHTLSFPGAYAPSKSGRENSSLSLSSGQNVS